MKKKSEVPSVEMISYLDTFFSIHDFPDNPKALNGVQVEPPGRIRKVGLAVDLTYPILKKGIEKNLDLLIVHHGVLWDLPFRFTGHRKTFWSLLLNSGIGVYGIHLPLDAHPEIGNNIHLSRKLQLEELQRFGEYRGRTIGFKGVLLKPLSYKIASKILGFPLREKGVPPPKKRPLQIGIVSGNGRGFVEEAIASGVDIFLTGEVDHHGEISAREGGITLWLGGHYETECGGLKDLGVHLEEKFGVETLFLSPDR